MPAQLLIVLIYLVFALTCAGICFAKYADDVEYRNDVIVSCCFVSLLFFGISLYAVNTLPDDPAQPNVEWNQGHFIKK